MGEPQFQKLVHLPAQSDFHVQTRLCNWQGVLSADWLVTDSQSPVFVDGVHDMNETASAFLMLRNTLVAISSAKEENENTTSWNDNILSLTMKLVCFIRHWIQ